MLQDIVQKKWILCVDDQAAVTDLLTLWLKMDGFEVLSASNCKEALSLIEQQSFEVCIFDAYLPDGTGIELCQQVKQRLPATSFILNTGDTRETLKAEAVALGMEILPKPTDLDRLQEVVRTLSLVSR